MICASAMPRYYCDYCDTHLTHDSPSVRKQHNAGYKHKANVREYYQQFEQLQTQTLIDQKIKEHLSQGGMYQIGAAFNQHLATVSGFQGPRPPLLPQPILPYPGAAPSQMGLGFRPPSLPRPGYGMPPQIAQIPGQPPPQIAQIPGQQPPQMAQIPGQPPVTSNLPPPPNGLPRPPPMSAPEGMPTPTPSGAPPMYQPNPTGGAPPASAPTDSYAFAPATGR